MLGIRSDNAPLTDYTFVLAFITCCLKLRRMSIISSRYLMNHWEAISCSLTRSLIISISFLLVIRNISVLCFTSFRPKNSIHSQYLLKITLNRFGIYCRNFSTNVMSSANVPSFTDLGICNFSRASYMIFHMRGPSTDPWGTSSVTLYSLGPFSVSYLRILPGKYLEPP